MHWLLKTPPKKIALALKNRALPNLRHLGKSRIRTCRCCRRKTIFLTFSEGEEFRVCIRCRANLRYEMFAEHLRHVDLEQKDVVEFDRDSPLRMILSNSKRYIRTFYDPTLPLGFVANDGSQVQDITNLTFANASVDLMISGDVLEHVPDLNAAFGEMRRVLRPGGMHLFTVPTQPQTPQLAKITDGKIKNLILSP